MGPTYFRQKCLSSNSEWPPCVFRREMQKGTLPEGPRMAVDAFQFSCLTSLSGGLLSGPGDSLGYEIGTHQSPSVHFIGEGCRCPRCWPRQRTSLQRGPRGKELHWPRDCGPGRLFLMPASSCCLENGQKRRAAGGNSRNLSLCGKKCGPLEKMRVRGVSTGESAWA